MNGIFGVHRCEFHRSRRQKSQNSSIFIAKRVSFTCWFRPFPSPSYLNEVDIIRIRMSQCQPNRPVGENSSQLQRIQFFPYQSLFSLFVRVSLLHIFFSSTLRHSYTPRRLLLLLVWRCKEDEKKSHVVIGPLSLTLLFFSFLIYFLLPSWYK